MAYDKVELSQRVTDLDVKLAALSDDTLAGILNSIIHRPGWTTLPEAALTQVAVDALHAHADTIRTTYQQLIEAAKLVGTAG